MSLCHESVPAFDNRHLPLLTHAPMAKKSLAEMNLGEVFALERRFSGSIGSLKTVDVKEPGFGGINLVLGQVPAGAAAHAGYTTELTLLADHQQQGQPRTPQTGVNLFAVLPRRNLEWQLTRPEELGPTAGH